MTTSPKPEKTYGSNTLIKRIGTILEGKYDSEIASSMGSAAGLREAQLQTLLLCGILEELHKFTSLMTQSSEVCKDEVNHS
jgi:hypothetical protein